MQERVSLFTGVWTPPATWRQELDMVPLAGGKACYKYKGGKHGRSWLGWGYNGLGILVTMKGKRRGDIGTALFNHLYI